MRAWIYQDSKQLKKKGADDASWFVGWYDPEGKQRCKSCGSGEQGRRNAEKFQRRIEGELAAGTYQMNVRKTWKEFRTEFDEKVLPGKRISTQLAYKYCLDNFERIVKPVRLQAITTKTVNDFVAARRKEPGMRKGTLVGKATINKELRHLRAALRKAQRLGLLVQGAEVQLREGARRSYRPTCRTPTSWRSTPPANLQSTPAICPTASRPANGGGDC